ncbi:MAG TPA: 2-phospho-L-lactate guanylyltransferase [Phototrophicaceae bacterium]|jgi:2-phospho-L-lactate guanylyltransferase|nr:2-phospho-L-lactate guanylyltransferase [Phototrophicaceae bacterium]
MSTWVVIPVKPLRLAKSRLAKVLSPEQRQHFAELMLRHVLGVVTTVPQVTGTLVISRDNRALALARDYGAKTIQESGTPELNAALMRATRVVAAWRSDAILILPADLPLLQAEDVTGIIKLSGQDDPCVVLATDRARDGTNAMLVRPPGLIRYTYGAGSFDRHGALARDAGASVYLYESERLMQDIDLPEDVENFYRMTFHRNYDSSIPLSEAFDMLQAEIDRQ